LFSVGQAIWDHSGGQRKKKGTASPGAPDVYRATVYRRDPLSSSFEVLHTLIGEGDEDEDIKVSEDDSNVVLSPPSQ
jgi:arginine decarboxylase-like protein